MTDATRPIEPVEPVEPVEPAEQVDAAAAEQARLQPERRTTDVVVIGGGVAGLVAALECAKVGLRVTVLERREAIGGCVGRIELDGLTLDSGAESFATRGGAVATLLEQLGLADDIAKPNPAGAWLVMPGRDGRPDAAPLPRTGMLGIPANPLGEDVRRIIGWSGAWRAYLDRLKPILTIGRAHSLGQLVRDRMGDAVLDRLVAPISAGVYSTNPDDLDLDVVAPGLNEAMTRMGSLSGGVGQLLEERKAGTAVLGLRGGMHRLVDALATQLERFGVDVVTGAEVTGLARRSARADTTPDAATGTGWRVDAVMAGASDDEAHPVVVDATYVVVAAPAEASRRLLDAASLGWSDASDWPPAASVELVTLVLDAPALDASPRGTGVLVAAGTPGITAKALDAFDGEVAVARGARGRPPRRAPLVRTRGGAEPARRADRPGGGRPRARRRERHARNAARPVVGAGLRPERLARRTVAGHDRTARPRARARGRARRRARHRGDRIVGRRHGTRLGDPARDRGGAPHPPPRGRPGRHRIAETEYSRATPLRDPARGLRLERSLW